MGNYYILAECGTRSAKRRHRRNGEQCEYCIKTLQSHGTTAAIRRHHRHKTPLCEPCKIKVREIATLRRLRETPEQARARKKRERAKAKLKTSTKPKTSMAHDYSYLTEDFSDLF